MAELEIIVWTSSVNSGSEKINKAFMQEQPLAQECLTCPYV